MSVTPLSIDNIHCNRPMADRSLPTKYVPQLPTTVPQRKQSVFVAPSGLSSIIPPPPPPPLTRSVYSPPRKSPLAKPNAQVLEQHISKIISENAAIVETLDPLWSKRYNISRNNSTSQVPNLSANGLSVLTSHHTSSDSLTGAGGQSQRRYSEQPLSKLQSALMGKTSGPSQTSPPIRKYSEMSASESSQQSVIINAKDTNNNNNNNINCNNSNNLNNKNSGSDGRDEQFGTSESIVRNLLTTKTPAIQVTPPPDKSPPLAGTHPQNPEGSIIKDLLLKSRDENQRKKSRSESGQNGPQAEQESSMLVYVCTVCNIAFRNKENLEVHQVHYCKGNDDLSHSRPSRHKMEDLVQRKVSVMARPGFVANAKHYPRLSAGQHKLSVPSPPVGNILKQQLLAPNEGPPLKKRKISEPVFRTNTMSSDIQIIEEHSVRRISVVQSTHPTVANPSLTSKSSRLLDVSVGAPIASLPSITASHTVIQPVLHSGATVIDNYLSPHSKGSRSGAPMPHMTTSTEPVHKSATDLVSSRQPIEILPDYMPHLKRPERKITFKGPLLFPVLKNMCANGTNTDFAVDECGSYKPLVDSDGKTRVNSAFRQVASLPIDSTNNDKPSDDSIDEEVEILDKDKENDKHLTPVSSPSNGLVTLKTTGAVRPRTLSLRTNNQLISSTLVSPDTPRSNKHCVQLFMNGHAYSRIGLKVTPRPVYCTIYKTQPMFVPQETDPSLSMYSNWTVSPLGSEDIMNFAPPPVVLGLYDSRPKQRSDSMVIASAGKTDLNSTHSSYWQFRKSDEEKENLKDLIEKLREDVGDNVEEVYRKLSEEVSAGSAFSGDTDSDGGDANPPKRVRIFEGGFKSNEDYTYVRGRGRGKYVCEECGIRCKKPSMLKKHIRTHTDLRPYSCRHCAFAFKTKGNLTKHMKSKAHHKKCVELGIIPVPITIDDSQIDTDALAKQEMLEITCGNLPEDEDEDEDEGEWDEDEEDEDDEGVPIPLIELQRMDARTVPVVPGQFDDADLDDERLRAVSESGSAATEAEEQEAARSLLILSGSGSESDLTNPSSRKTSTVVSEDFPVQEKRKVSVIDSPHSRRISQQVIEEQHRRVSQQVMEEHHRRISQHLMEAEQQRRISQHSMEPLKAVELPDFNRSPTIMKPPTEPPLLSSPRKLSPIEQLQQQVQQQHQQLLHTTWTPNCDQLTRTRSYSFNDVPIPPTMFASTSRPPIEPMSTHEHESITDESSDESLDSFASRRYSMSIIGDRKFEAQPKSLNPLSAIPEGEEPMDLSVSAKANDAMDDNMMSVMNQSDPIPKIVPTSLRHGEFIPTAPQSIVIETIDGKSICSICSKQFSKPSQLRLHINIHYFERPFRCDSCAVSFRTKGHLQKHKRSVSHFNKVNMNMTFGTPTIDNPRPFKCADCKIAFRIHGHLAKHLRSKMHIMKLECLGKLPFGMYAEMERSGVNLNEIDTTDCENSLQSLQAMAQRLYDPRQMRWASEPVPEVGPPNDSSYDDEDPSHVKNEPNAEAFYHHLEGRERQLLANPIRSPPEPQLSSVPPIQSEAPSSPPQTIESPPVPHQTTLPTPPVTGVQPTSGFTSTRSNTCHICGRMFKGAKFLQVHLYCDHPEGSSPQMEETQDFECDICHKDFSDSLALQQHQLSHTTSRPYVCEICDAGFTTDSLLESHLQTHHSLVQHKT